MLKSMRNGLSLVILICAGHQASYVQVSVKHYDVNGQNGFLHSQSSSEDYDHVSKSTPLASFPMKDSVLVNWQRDSSVCARLRSKSHAASEILDLLHTLSSWVAT